MIRAVVYILLLSISAALVHGAVAETLSEIICTNPMDDPPGPDTTVACYTDAGCAFAESLGAEGIRDYDVESAPFALARGKISAIVTSSKDLIKTAEVNGAACSPTGK